MNTKELHTIAGALVAPGKGILAADESFPTIEKRLRGVGVESTEETRRVYRELLFTAPRIQEHISGVILFDETIRQAAADGTPLREVLQARGIIPGIKVDKGTKPLAGFPGEKITEGLDGLRERLSEYRELGARFAKWRAVICIGRHTPTWQAIECNAHALARFAALCQEAGLVPIVEPEVLMDGEHSIEQCEEATERTLCRVFSILLDHRVFLEGMILKPNMVLPGKACANQSSVDRVAKATVRCLRRAVPAAVPGICFLSGGQSAIQATEHLNAINILGIQPWALSFSFARALQEPAMSAWRGDPKNTAVAQTQLLRRARCNSAARQGSYSKDNESENRAA